MIGSRLNLIERASELAEVAALGVAMGVYIRRQRTVAVGGVVRGASGDVEHGRSFGSKGPVRTGGDAAAALGTKIGVFGFF